MAAHQAPLSLGFSRQEHWSRLPFPSPMHETEKWKWSRSVVSDSYRPHGLQPTRLLHPWDFPGKSTGVGCHCLLHHDSIGNTKNSLRWNESNCFWGITILSGNYRKSSLAKRRWEGWGRNLTGKKSLNKWKPMKGTIISLSSSIVLEWLRVLNTKVFFH